MLNHPLATMELMHRYFVQHMLHNSILTKQAAFQYYLLLAEKAGRREQRHDDTTFTTFINAINAEITKQFFKLVFFTCEVTNKELLMFINMKQDECSKAQVYSNKKELEYFHVVMQEILQSNHRRIAVMTCLNLASTLTARFTKEAGQNAMEKWLKQGYFAKELDYIYLGPLLISEFTGYLRTNYPDNLCSLCSELVFTGKTCHSCHKTAHVYCLERFKNVDKCPSCQNQWTEQVSFTQDSQRHTQESLGGSDDSGHEGTSRDTLGPSLRKRRRLLTQQS